MNTREVHRADCPNCGAPLDLKRVRNSTVGCSYCGITVALRSLATFAADPAAIEALDKAATPPTLAERLLGATRGYFELPVAFGAAWSLVATWFVFQRNPGGLAVVWCVVAAIAAMVALARKRRLAAIALTFAVGGLTALKPLLVPILDAGGRTYAATSETALLQYVVPGAALLGLGVIAVLSIRPARLKTDLALLKPTLRASIGFVAGAALAVWAHGGTTNRDLLERNAERLQVLRQSYARIADAIEAAPAGSLPSQLEGLDPRPKFVEGDPASNTDFTPLAEMRGPWKDSSPNLFLDGALTSILERSDAHWNWDDWEYREDLERQLAVALATRYVAAFRCEEREDPEDFFEGCVVWLADVPAARVLLRAPVSTLSIDSFRLGDEILEALERATGGTFRRAGGG